MPNERKCNLLEPPTKAQAVNFVTNVVQPASLKSIHDVIKSRLLTMSFTTTTFDRSNSWLFEASPYRTAPKGLPSSSVQHGTFVPS